MYYLHRDNNRTMSIAIAFATGVHLALVLGVTFQPAGNPDYTPQLDVTLATRPSRSAPEEARHIAQANQEGSGSEAEFNEVSARRPQAAPIPMATSMRNPVSDQSREQGADAQLAARAHSERQATRERRSRERPPELAGINPRVDQLSRELADLQARLDEQSQAYSDLPRVRRLTSLSAKQSADAAYLQDWRQRVEAVGNKYYPEASVRYGIYGSLRLLVVIRYDGYLEDISILASSGFEVLDEAAIKIVRMAAPFSPFPSELRAIADRVEIIRTWQFQENRLSSG